jgi:hypothetical protein
MDLTIVGRTNSGNKVQPNSNVLFEAGYVLAMMRRRNVDPPPVIIVMNTFFGAPEQLPFDLGWRPVIRYEVGPDAEEKDRREAGARLARQLASALASILAGGALFADLSPAAWRMGTYLDKAWEEGLAVGKYYDASEVAGATGMSPEDVDRGCAELLEKGLVEELQAVGRRQGWPVRPTAKLFLTLDPFCREWDPGVDARQILEDFGTRSETQIAAARLQEKYGWELRRLEPAMAKLVDDLLAEPIPTRQPPFKYPYLRLTRRADLFVRGLFDPGTIPQRS